jgi:hypothetical protein
VKPLVECHRCGSLHAPPVIVLDRRYFCPRCSARAKRAKEDDVSKHQRATCELCGVPLSTIGEVNRLGCQSCFDAAARRERVRKAIERALGEMYPSFASHRIASGIVTDAALAAMDSDGGAA